MGFAKGFRAHGLGVCGSLDVFGVNRAVRFPKTLKPKALSPKALNKAVNPKP